ncbi:MAG: hypothetical protein ABFR75_04595 [Acidobacteriota bacterium]
MKKLNIFMIFIIFFSVYSYINGDNNNKKIQIELFGGYSGLNPTHLNLWPDYQEGRDNFYTIEKNEYYHIMNGDYFTYEGNITGNYKKIKSGMPFGARVKYFLNPSFAISLGFKYFNKKQTSLVESDYSFNSYYNGEYSQNDISDPLYIYSEGFTPMAGAHYIILKNSMFEAEGFLNVGIMFASCGMTYDNYSKSTYDSGYIREYETILQYTGEGSGFAAEAGLRTNIKLSGSLGIFAEGGYSFQKVSNITGDGSYKYAEKDSNSDGYSEGWSWTGKWKVSEYRADREWGSWNYSYYFPGNENENARDFILDLSGFFLRIGISLKL